MLQTEFKELMGLKEITEEQYTQADKIYLACDLEKKTFCNLYKHCSPEAISLLDNIVDILKEARAYQKKLSSEITTLRDRNEHSAITALEHYNSAMELSRRVSEDYARAFEEDARMLFDIASRMLGYRKAVLMCIQNGYPLFDAEREYIYHELNKKE
jgi:hypothetical protein